MTEEPRPVEGSFVRPPYRRYELPSGYQWVELSDARGIYWEVRKIVEEIEEDLRETA